MIEKVKISKWVPISDPKLIRRLGKNLEEVNELGAILARCLIQGLDGIDPKNGKENIVCLREEISDVLAQCVLTVGLLQLSESEIEARVDDKLEQMRQWESYFDE